MPSAPTTTLLTAAAPVKAGRVVAVAVRVTVLGMNDVSVIELGATGAKHMNINDKEDIPVLEKGMVGVTLIDMLLSASMHCIC